MRVGDSLCQRYELRSLLATGGMGSVWCAYDLRLDREVAIKLNSGQAGSALLDEGRAVAQLEHPNIVAVYDADSHAGQPFIVMEYVDGPSLRTVLRDRETLSEEEAVKLGIELLSALTYAHSRGIWHNDVKPENVLLGPDGEARLTDFGIASMDAPTVDIAVARELFTTPAYAAPEVLAGSPAGPSADLYATATTLYECVSGILPTRPLSSDAPKLFESLSGVSEGLNAVLARALALDPEQRFQSPDQFRIALQGSRGSTHPTVPIAVPASREATLAPGGYKRSALAALVAFIMVGAIGAALLFSGSGEGEDADDAQAIVITDTPTPTATPTPEATATPTAQRTPLPTATPAEVAPRAHDADERSGPRPNQGRGRGNADRSGPGPLEDNPGRGPRW